MNTTPLRLTLLLIIVSGLFLMIAGMATAQDDPTEEPTGDENTALIERGEYLAKIANCETCHTPFQEKYNNLAELTLEDLQTIAMREELALDKEERLMAGGRPFDLGPAGVMFTRNLTPDPETGLGEWTDEEIEIAIRTGISRDGRQLHPLMPYTIFNQMADADMDAIIAYLRSIPAVENAVPVIDFGLPNMGLPMSDEEIVMPDPEAEPEAYRHYLLTSVLGCTHCHTPVDPNTGAPMMDQFLGGGQPYEGPWGIVYGTNLTPHENGLAAWSEDDIARVLTSGVRIDGRRLILMPWQDYANLTLEDLDAVITYLVEDLEPIDTLVPAAALNEGFDERVELSN